MHLRDDQLPLHHGCVLLQLSAPAPSDPRRRWITAALIALSLLVVPFVGWIVIPAPSPPAAHSGARPDEAPAPRPPPAPVGAALPKGTVGRPPAQEGVAGEVEGEAQDRLVAPTGIAGNVVDEAGAPVSVYGIGVASFTPPGGDAGAPAVQPPAFREIADAQGAFELTDLAPGRYVLIVGPAIGALTRSQAVDVSPGAMTRGVRIALAPGVTVTGRVTDAVTHAPIDGAVAFVVFGGISSQQPRTQRGEFTLDDAPVGRFDLRVRCAGYRTKFVRDLEGRPGGPPLRVDVALDRPGAP